MDHAHSDLDKELVILRKAVMKRLAREPVAKLAQQMAHDGLISARKVNHAPSSTHQMDSQENSASESWFRRLLQRVKFNSN